MRHCRYTKYLGSPVLTGVLALALTLSLSTGAIAAGQHRVAHDKGITSIEHDEGKGHPNGSKVGRPGKASEVSRTITITMTDNRYTPENIEIRKGETIRFVMKNDGEFVHEFNIGTAETHKTHQQEMMLMVDHGVLEPDRINYARMKMDMGGGKTMEHNDPNSALLEPKKSGEIIWKFDTDATLEFACNIPGHYESGMVGKIIVH